MEKVDSYKEIGTKFITMISIIVLTMVLSLTTNIINNVINIAMSTYFSFYIIFKFNILEKIDLSKNFIISIISTLLSSSIIIKIFYTRTNDNLERVFEILKIENNTLLFKFIIYITFTFISGLALFIFYLYIYNKYLIYINKFIKSINEKEKYFILTTIIIASIILLYIYMNTSVFTLPTDKLGNEYEYDILFTTDNGGMVKYNMYFNSISIFNDFMQPLYTIASLPFTLIASFISIIISLIFKINFLNIFYYFLGIMQILCISIMAIILNRLAKGKLLNLIYIITFPTMLFMPTVEQYVFSTFWLIIFIYSVLNRKEEIEDETLILSIGSLMTSLIIAPIILNRSYDSKRNINRIKKIVFKYVGALSITGMISIYLNVINLFFNNLSSFGGASIALKERVYQYINFIKLCFIGSKISIDTLYNSFINFRYESYVIKNYNVMTLQLSQVSKIEIIGIIIIIIAIVGFILNINDKFAKICMLWITFSFFLLCIVGYGTKENGLILYTFYFSWAYICLVYMAITKIFSKVPLIKNIILTLMILLIFITNIKTMINIIQFGISYYPTIYR